MRRDKTVDCEACWQRDCDCECRTCADKRKWRIVCEESLKVMQNTQIIGDFSNQPRLKRV